MLIITPLDTVVTPRRQFYNFGSLGTSKKGEVMATRDNSVSEFVIGTATKTKQEKMICSDPDFSDTCNCISIKQCRYFTICEDIIYNQVTHPLYVGCPGWYDDDREFSDFIKLVYKSYPNCPFCGKKLEHEKRTFSRDKHMSDPLEVRIFGLGRIGNVKGSGEG